MYPSLQELASQDHLVEQLGSSFVHKTKVNEQEVVYKTIPKRNILFYLHWVDEEIQAKLLKSPPVIHISKSKRSVEQFKEITQLWIDANIPTAHILYQQDNTLVIEYVGNQTVGQALQGNNKEEVFNSFLNTYVHIKDEAQRNNDKKFLHPDSWLKNYIYNEQNKTTYAIDPEGTFRRSSTFDESLASMNLRIILNLLNGLHEPLIKQFCANMSKREKNALIEINNTASQLWRTYMTVREHMVSPLVGRKKIRFTHSFTEEKVETINDYLTSTY